MILTRTPLRVSLFGGGTDIPSFYRYEPGRVLSTTIDKYMYIALCKTAYEGVKLVYNNVELAASVDEITHSRVREALKLYKVSNHIEISSFCEIPTKGTGLGSSSTFTVGLVNALNALTGTQANKFDMAETACGIEIDLCKEPIGKQDQYAASFGGINSIRFYEDTTTVIKLSVGQEATNILNSNLLMFYTGIQRDASTILAAQNANADNRDFLREMVDITIDAEISLEKGHIDELGSMLHESWQLKKKLTDNISTPFIDHYYDAAMKAGALGGKILGAGGGGYLLFYVPLEQQASVRHALSDLKEFDFNFEDTGTTVVYNESKRSF